MKLYKNDAKGTNIWIVIMEMVQAIRALFVFKHFGFISVIILTFSYIIIEINDINVYLSINEENNKN